MNMRKYHSHKMAICFFQQFRELVFLFVFLCFLSIPQSGMASDYYRVTSSSLNVRSAPSKNATKLFSVSSGEVVNVIGLEGNGWMKIEVNGSIGYASAQYLERIQQAPALQETNSRTAKGSGSSGETLAFWVSLVLSLLLIFGFYALVEDLPYLALLCNLGAAICLAIYATRPADAFWFLDFDKRGVIVYFILLILIYAFMTIVFHILWEDLCMIKGLFSSPLLAIMGVLAGLVWLYAVMWLVADFMSEHTFVAILAIIGSIPSSRYLGSFVDRDGVKWDVYEA